MKIRVGNIKTDTGKLAFIEFVEGERSAQIQIPQWDMSRTETLHFLQKLALDYQRMIYPVRITASAEISSPHSQASDAPPSSPPSSKT